MIMLKFNLIKKKYIFLQAKGIGVAPSVVWRRSKCIMLYIVYCVLCCDMKIIVYYELYPCVLGIGVIAYQE